MAKCKGKGSSFEREICKMLSKWWSGNESSSIFWRTSNSGGRATIRSRKKQATFGQYGDVQATDPIGQPLIDLCTIELKRGYKGASIGDLIDTGPKAAVPIWEKFVIQAREDHIKAKSFAWLLITRRDRRQIMCYFPTKLFKCLVYVGCDEIRDVRPLTRVHTLIDNSQEIIYGIPFSEFLRTVSADNIIEGGNYAKETRMD